MKTLLRSALWFVATYAFWKGIRSWRWSVAFGVVWGFALAPLFFLVLIVVGTLSDTLFR